MRTVSEANAAGPTSGGTLPSSALSGTPRARLDSIDLLRGLIMLVMALDHTREFFTAGRASPRDVTEPALFLTRWITHFCASNFILLAGFGAFLYVARRRTRKEGSVFLLTRGLWLIFLELTVIRLGWSFELWPGVVLLQVIWAIGWSMVILAGFLFLPRSVVGAIALATIAGHNLFDSVQPEAWGGMGWLWSLLHKPAFFQLTPEIRVLAFYPLVPWVAVLAAGYAFGPVFTWSPERRQRALLVAGTLLLVLFVLLRTTGIYGDPVPWRKQESVLPSILSFLDCEKYPPSLLFLCMSIGPALLALAWFDKWRGALARFFITFGRVPLFYYVLHIYLIHLLALALAVAQRRNPAWLLHGLPPMANPADWDLSLPAVYGVWTLVVLLLWMPCHWFAQLKQRKPAWWMSYL